MDTELHERLIDLADELDETVEYCLAKFKECQRAGDSCDADIWAGQFRAHMRDLEQLQRLIKEMEV